MEHIVVALDGAAGLPGGRLQAKEPIRPGAVGDQAAKRAEYWDRSVLYSENLPQNPEASHR